MDIFIPILAIASIFIALPWLILHYTTQWKRAGGMSREDEDLLDELHALARRLDERMDSIERIVAADNPEWQRERLLNQDRARTEDRPADFRNHDNIRRL